MKTDPLSLLGRNPMGTVVRLLRDALIGLAFPQMCALCKTPVDSLDDGITCRACWRLVSTLDPEACCGRCGFPWPVRSGPSRPSCPQCRDASFAQLRYMGPYEGALRQNLHFLKTHPFICRRLKCGIVETVRRERVLHRATRIIAIPLHPRRQKERGFNQGALIAGVVARETGIPYVRRAVIRVKHTGRHRVGMDAMARVRSLTGAFAVRGPACVRDQVVLVVDDVFTTGATLNECAKALLQAGAEAVYGFTAARVIPTTSRVNGVAGLDDLKKIPLEVVEGSP